MKRITVIVLILLFTQIQLWAADKKYMVTVSVLTKVTVTRNKPCTKKVKVRKDGRWTYIKKRSRCPEEVEVWKRYNLKKIIRADNPKEAREEAKEYYDDEGYRGIRVLKVIRLK